MATARPTGNLLETLERHSKDIRKLKARLRAGDFGEDDHGALSGLGDDDHSIYVLADGTRDITGNQRIAEYLEIGDISTWPTTPWGEATALYNGSFGHMGSHRLGLHWNYDRGSDSAFYNLGANGFTTMGAIEIGNDGITFRYEDNATPTAQPELVAKFDATGLVFGSPTSSAAVSIAGGEAGSGGLLVESWATKGHSWLGYNNGNNYLTVDAGGLTYFREHDGASYDNAAHIGVGDIEFYADPAQGVGHLSFEQSGDDWYIYNKQQDNGIVIYDGSGGVEIHYAGVKRIEVDSGSIKFGDSLDMQGNHIDMGNGYIHASGTGDPHIRFSSGNWVAFYNGAYQVLAYSNRVEMRNADLRVSGSYEFYGDTDTKVYRQSTNHIGMRAGGKEAFVATDDAVHISKQYAYGTGSSFVNISDQFGDIGNHETLRADRLGGGAWDTTEIGYYSSRAVDPETGVRYKTDITKAHDAAAATYEDLGPSSFDLSWIDRVHPSFYQRTRTKEALASVDGKGGWEFGFVLEDLLEVSPYLTTKPGEREGFSPDQFAIMAVLWEGERDLRARVRELESKVAELEARL